MPYLTIPQYLARYGERETILATNTTPPAPGVAATYDVPVVEAAIEDAGAVVESYVGKRYVTPIADPPRIVLGWVAALAREAIHVNTGRSNQTIQDAADRVRSQLLQVSRGDLTLPIAEGADPLAPAPSSAGYAQSSNDRIPDTFSGGQLDGFTSMFGGNGVGGCWRRGG